MEHFDGWLTNSYDILNAFLVSSMTTFQVIEIFFLKQKKEEEEEIEPIDDITYEVDEKVEEFLLNILDMIILKKMIMNMTENGI